MTGWGGLHPNPHPLKAEGAAPNCRKGEDKAKHKAKAKKRRVANGCIEERFLSAQADAFAQSEREEKASAYSARNDRHLVLCGFARNLGEARYTFWLRMLEDAVRST